MRLIVEGISFNVLTFSAYENMSRFEILTGHPGDGIRYLFFAAKYCILEDDFNWAYYDTDLACTLASVRIR